MQEEPEGTTGTGGTADQPSDTGTAQGSAGTDETTSPPDTPAAGPFRDRRFPSALAAALLLRRLPQESRSTARDGASSATSTA
jgi:hypothetical protein